MYVPSYNIDAYMRIV